MVSESHITDRLLSELLVGIKSNDAVPSMMINGVTLDNRRVVPGGLFIALKGIQHHGIDFAMDAVRSGASIILYDAWDNYCRHRIPLLQKQINTGWLGIEHLQRQTGVIASRFYHQPGHDLTIIGVTGTDGKTSVTHLLSQALMRLGHATGSIGTLGYGINNQLQQTRQTTPDATELESYLYQFKQRGCRFVVMEVSSHALMQYRLNGCPINIAVLTNLGRDHLDYHGSIEQYAAAKARLFNDFDLDGCVLNADDPFGRQLAETCPGDGIICYSTKGESCDDAEIRLIRRTITGKGQQIEVATPLGEVHMHTGLMGDFNVDNTLACVASLILLGFDRMQISQALADLQAVPGRMQSVCASQALPGIVIDFAHTEQALQACLQTSRQHTSGKLWCVFGCGGDRDPGKRAGMGRIAEQLADYLIITDDNPRTESAEAIVTDILSGMRDPDRAKVIHDRSAAIEFAVSQAHREDLVVIAGKGHEQVQIIGHKSHAISDHDIVKRIVERVVERLRQVGP